MLKRILLLSLLSLSASQATIITVTDVDWNRGGSVSFLSDNVEQTGFAGVIYATYNGTPGEFFCVDLFTGISYGDYDSTPILPRASRNEDRVAWLFVNELPNVTTSQMGQAMQLAIWDIVHDGGDGLGAGRIQASGNTNSVVVQAVQGYLSLSVGRSSYLASIYLNASMQTGEPAQAFIGAPQPSMDTQVPEPSSLIMLSTAGLILMGARGLISRVSRRG